MRIIELVQKMGGVCYLHSDTKFQPVLKNDLAKLMDINNPAFQDYVDYLTYFGGETYFKQNYQLHPIRPTPEYYDTHQEWHIEIEFGGVNIGTFFGEGENFDESYQISHNQEFFLERIPQYYLPIACDVFGNLILLCTTGENIGKIYFWDGDYDADADEFFEDYGVKMPEEVKFRNMFLIGDNLYDCFLNMTLNDE